MRRAWLERATDVKQDSDTARQRGVKYAVFERCSTAIT